MTIEIYISREYKNKFYEVIMMEMIEFYNGEHMPKIGLGTFRVENDDDCKNAVKQAIINGYRSIDTAKVYGNEENSRGRY